MLLKIVIIVILIVINILAFIYMYKNDNDEIDYDKWCKMLQDETKNNIATIRRNEERINKLICFLNNIFFCNLIIFLCFSKLVS